MIDDDGVFRRGPRPAAPRPRPERRRPPAEPSLIERLSTAARPSGRLPALDPKAIANHRYAKRWKEIRSKIPEPPRASEPAYEQSRYDDDQEDD